VRTNFRQLRVAAAALVATALVGSAGVLLRGYADRRALDVDTKTSDTDPVSEADRASERLITESLAAAQPDDGILGEEEADRRGTTGRRWVIDPLDGTVNFLYGIPAWCVSIACEDETGGLVGVVHDPIREETFAAHRGGGATLNGVAVQVSAVRSLEHALVATGFSYGPEVRSAQGGWAADLLGQARDLRRVGSAAIDLAWTAAGRVDGFYEFGLSRWDYAAGLLLVREAGGIASESTGTVAGVTGSLVVAGGSEVHDALATWLAERAAWGGA
jgi:myo-inositol-1(or 4)-monophosphatase